MNRTTDRRILALLIFYFFVRVFVSYLLIAIFKNSIPIWITLFLETAAFIIVSALIWVARDDLRKFHIDNISFLIILIFATILHTNRSSGFSLPHYISYFFFVAISILLFVGIWRTRLIPRQFRRKDLYWSIYGLLIGFACAGIFAAPRLILLYHNGNIEWVISKLGIALAFGFIEEFGHTAILEEPIFRGFLWGYLQERGWSVKRIWLFQAGLFWISHLGYIGHGYSFWITLPASGLILGYLAWRSRSIAPSMFAHAALNTIARII